MVAITDDDNSRDACVIPILEVGVDDVGFFGHRCFCCCTAMAVIKGRSDPCKWRPDDSYGPFSNRWGFVLSFYTPRICLRLLTEIVGCFVCRLIYNLSLRS